MNNIKNIGDTIKLYIKTKINHSDTEKVEIGYGFIINYEDLMESDENFFVSYKLFLLKIGDKKNVFEQSYSDSTSLFSSKIILIEKFNKEFKSPGSGYVFENSGLIRDINF